MQITHDGKSYKVTPMASNTIWRLTRVDSPREGFTVNRDWLVKHGHWQQVEQARIDANNLRAAQNKIVIATFLGDDQMWTQAVQAFSRATGAQL